MKREARAKMVGMDELITSTTRVLVVGIEHCPMEQLEAWARAAALLVGVGTVEAVRAARVALKDCDNVMFVVGDANEIPWQEAYFGVAIDATGVGETGEMRRVLADGGGIYSLMR